MKSCWLQWGRDLLVAESPKQTFPPMKTLGASMGPRLVSRGKLEKLSPYGVDLSLQWGRDLLVAERRHPWQIPAVKKSFNGAATC